MHLRIDSVEPLAQGQPFGPAGAYERVTGVAFGEVDPRDARNRVIVNLDKAPRNARGLVEYQADFFLLRPTLPERGNGTLLYEVTNRGRKLLPRAFLDAELFGPPGNNDPRTAADLGNGWLLRQGYTLLWSGWDPDAPRANHGMGMVAPLALERGAPLVQEICDELVSATRSPNYEPVARFRLSYPVASLAGAQGRLTVRRRAADAAQELPPERWRLVDERTLVLLPEGTLPEPGSLYHFTYRATGAPVLGLGFAAVRDVVSHLRAQDLPLEAPARGPLRAALAVGISQGGRFLRDFIHLGFNQDLSGRKVFDGVLTHVAGAGGVFLNWEFGQPNRTNTQHQDHSMPECAFPFSPAPQVDPVTGQAGALFRRDGFDPLLMQVNTSSEYWQKSASLLTTDPLGQRDVALPEGVRAYLVAGTQHTGAAGRVSDRGPCLHARNPHSPGPALRALLHALWQWVCEGIAPPPSRVPRIADGTALPPERLGFPALPGVAAARAANIPERFGDWVHPRPQEGPPYRPLVPRVDADGNEVPGLLLPDIAVPLGTYTGWNLYRAPYPECALCDRDGAFLPFARTRAERMQGGDPRPSLQERYGSHEAYVGRVAAVVEALRRERLLLPEDAQQVLQAARARRLWE